MRKAARFVLLVIAVMTCLGLAGGVATVAGQAGRAWNVPVADQIGPGTGGPVADQIGPGTS
jgi:hypothetical protein